ncbi:hypothetical protein EI94DRAFT_223287 [Lactarius quietus]|nr:hypothetical protein EI94DRAFT_223287 [Lactarius quietus]
MIRGEGGEPINGLIGVPQGTHTHTFEIGAPRSSYGFKQQVGDSPWCGAVRTPIQKFRPCERRRRVIGGTPFRLVRDQGGNWCRDDKRHASSECCCKIILWRVKEAADMINYRARCMDITVTKFTVWTRKISTIAPESLKEDPYRLITVVSHVLV